MAGCDLKLRQKKIRAPENESWKPYCAPPLFKVRSILAVGHRCGGTSALMHHQVMMARQEAHLSLKPVVKLCAYERKVSCMLPAVILSVKPKIMDGCNWWAVTSHPAEPQEGWHPGMNRFAQKAKQLYFWGNWIILTAEADELPVMYAVVQGW